MADILPLGSASSVWTGNGRQRYFFDPNTERPSVFAKLKNPSGHRLLTRYFTGLQNEDRYIIPRGVNACAWQPKGTADQIGAIKTNIGGGSDAPTIRFFVSGGGDGWLHMWIGGTERLRPTNQVTPVAKGTSGYTRPGWIYMNHKAAAPDTLASGKPVGSDSYVFHVLPFTTSTTSDRWVATSSGLFPGIVAVAWQADVDTDVNRVAVTLDAAGDPIFTSPAAPATGWLWLWRHL